MIEKPEIRKESKRHFKRKEDKLRQRIKEENIRKEKFEAEEMQKLQEEEENFIFHLADESLPSSSNHDDTEDKLERKLKEFPPSFSRFDYPVNESELLELKHKIKMGKSLDEVKAEKLVTSPNVHDVEMGIECGQKLGNRVILRSFHDRLYSEPRGKVNLHAKEESKLTLTHEEWLNKISSDPKFTVSGILFVPLILSFSC